MRKILIVATLAGGLRLVHGGPCAGQRRGGARGGDAR